MTAININTVKTLTVLFIFLILSSKKLLIRWVSQTRDYELYYFIYPIATEKILFHIFFKNSNRDLQSIQNMSLS